MLGERAGNFLELGRDLRLLDDGAVVVPQALLVDLAGGSLKKRTRRGEGGTGRGDMDRGDTDREKTRSVLR
jgi:hypothetical protein